MYVAYFDEVKADAKAKRNRYLVGGVVVAMEKIGEIENKVSALAVELFGHSELTTATEFHADYIYRAKGPFRGKSMADRAAILGRLADIIFEEGSMMKVYASIDTSKLYNALYAPDYAFMYFVERLQMCVAPNPCIMIGDLDDEQVQTMVTDFSRYRIRGTTGAYGVEIKCVVDSVHFCRSHHSRMIQLADAYVWLETHRWGERKGQMAKLVNEAIKDKNMWPNRYKHWPG